jgi:hypothetical protein
VAWGNVITQFDPTNQYATWNYKPASGSVYNHGLAVGGSALYANFGNTLRAIDRSTGAFLWDWTAPTFLTSNVVLTNSHLFVGGDTQTFAINLSTRAMDWSAPYSGALAIDKGFLFISNTKALHAFNLAVPEPSSVVLLMMAGALLRFSRTRATR